MIIFLLLVIWTLISCFVLVISGMQNIFYTSRRGGFVMRCLKHIFYLPAYGLILIMKMLK